MGSWCSSVSIAFDYIRDDRTTGVRSPAEVKEFSSSLCVQTISEAHPASDLTVIGDPFHGVKIRLVPDADHSPSSSAQVENE
jgi:hypothetical protein